MSGGGRVPVYELMGVREVAGGLLLVPPGVAGRAADGLRLRLAARELGPGRWEAVARDPSDVLVARRRPADGGPPVLVKCPRTGEAVRSLVRERDAVAVLAAQLRPPGLRGLLPRTLDSRLGGRPPVLVQEVLPGVPGDVLLSRRPELAAALTASAFGVLDELRGAAGGSSRDARLVDGWLGHRLAVLSDRVRWCRGAEGTAGLLALRAFLRRELTGHPVEVAWTHGDFTPGNLLLRSPDPAGRSAGQPAGRPFVTGLVDWADALADGPAVVDRASFALALGRLLEGRSWGEQVVRALRTGGLHRPETGELPLSGVLLAWLWHVSANLEKSRRSARNRHWLRAVLVPVLRELAAPPARPGPATRPD
ncbi:aminoglycoside phosphotransferase family protein [Kitasatospora sp. NPDC057198]|uniref:aminoglycoside phosphotransferase family protein n=1 Tax=Kitasatospora sp. NPDC057198 TaxID=3346046 RepID=UPI00362FE808